MDHIYDSVYLRGGWLYVEGCLEFPAQESAGCEGIFAVQSDRRCPWGILFGVCTAAQNPYVEKLSDKVMVGLIAGACDGGIIFVLCFVAFLIVGKVTKLREQKIENEMLGDDEDE